MERKVAFITGASRGIGRATSVALAEAGFDMVLTARTLKEGEKHEYRVPTPDGKPLPGSLEATADLVRSRGREALPLRMDLLDRASIDAAVEKALAAWGRIDVLVNNATYQGKGLNDPFETQQIVDLERVFQGNVLAPFYLTQKVVAHMVAHGGGIVINLTSGAAENDPPFPVWKGSWGFSYGASKGAFHRLAGILNVELGGKGIRAFNLQPGVVTTEAMLATLGEKAAMAKDYGSAPPEVPATVIRWLATSEDAREFLGKTVHAQSVARKRGLVPDWPPANA
ncbi:MAG: SDR family oxidoreductase [Chloroflexi bacterium]|nr:SDR family oxidoreductase [Chloroflexota bacterium]